MVVCLVTLWRNGRVVDGAGLENRKLKGSWVRILLPPKQLERWPSWFKATVC